MKHPHIVQSAVRKLGPERSEQALHAFDDPDRGCGWTGCALARAYGDKHELTNAVIDTLRRDGHRGYRDAVASLIGLTVDEVDAVAAAFDDDHSSGYRDELRVVLEGEAAKATARRTTEFAIHAVKTSPENGQ